MNVNSSLFREEKASVIREIMLKKLGEKRIGGISLLSGGMFNTTYQVTGQRQSWILQFGPVNSHRLMGFERHLMEAEVYMCNICREREIDAAHIYVCDTTREIVDRDYMIMEYVPGKTMVNTKMSAAEREALFEELGRYAARLHGITGEQFGFVSRIVKGEGSQSWWECLKNEAEDIVGRLESCGGVSGKEAETLLGVFYGCRELLDEIKVPHLLHTDLWEGNVLLDGEEGSLHVKLVIDGDRAVFGDVDFEWAAPWLTNPAVYRGAGISRQAFQEPKRVKRREIYRLFYYLTECYVGIGEYNNRQLHLDRKNQALGLVRKIQR